MDQEQQMVEQRIQLEVKDIYTRLVSQVKETDTMDVTITAALHFTGMLIAQHIHSESRHRAVDFQTELNMAVGVLINVVATIVNRDVVPNTPTITKH